MKKLEWLFAIMDRVSGPTSQMTKTLDAYKKKLEQLDGTTKNTERSSTSLFEKIAAGVTALGSLVGMVTSLARGLLDVGESAGRAAYGFGEFVIGIGAEHESSMVALRTVLGSQRQAQEVFNESLRIAQQTPFDTADVIRDRTQLVLAGFTANESRVLYGAAADIGAALGPDRMHTLMGAFQRIGASGGITGEAWQAIDSSGLGRRAIFEQMARRMGRTQLLNNQRQLRAWAEPMIQHMSSDQALSLIVQTISTKFGGGRPVGSFAAAQSATISGIVSNLRSLPHDLFIGLNIEQIPGIVAFKQFLLDFMDAIQGAGTRGIRLKVVLSEIIDDLFGGLFQNGAQGMSGAVDLIVTGLERFERVLRVIVPLARSLFGGFMSALVGHLSESIRGVGGDIGSLPLEEQQRRFEQMGRRAGDALGSIIDAIGRIMGELGRAASSTSPDDSFTRIGERLGAALAHGVVHAFVSGVGEVTGLRQLVENLDTTAGDSAYQEMMTNIQVANNNAKIRQFEAGHAMGTALHQGAAAALEIRSPSRVFEHLGEMSAEGFQLGMSNALGGIGALGKSAIRVEHAVSVHATGDGETNERAADSIASHVSSQVRNTLRRFDMGPVTE